MKSASVRIQDAKLHLSKYIKMVQQGTEVIITDHGRPVGKIIPIQTKELPLLERIKLMEDQGLIDPIAEKTLTKISLPIPVPEGIAQKLLQEDR